MRAHVLVALIAVLFPCGDAFAARGDCGAVDAKGSCGGAVLTWCENQSLPTEHVSVLDCATGVFPASVTGQCTVIDADYGADCVAAVGDSCRLANAAGETTVVLCGGRSAGCVVDDRAHTSACRENVGPCTPATNGASFVPSCSGNVLVTGCQVNQPVAVDCGAMGGACMGGKCVNLPVAAPCDGMLRTCAGSLRCDNNLCVDPTNDCVPGSFVPSCNGASLTVCSTESHQREAVDCTQSFVGSAGGVTCGPQFSCVDDGSGACAAVGSGCVGSAAGSRCSVEQGILCAAGLGCVMKLDTTGVTQETCQVTASCARGDTAKGCANNVATFCLGNSNLTAVEAGGFDCTSLASTCVVDATLGPVCVGGVGARCDDVEAFPLSPFRCQAGLECANGGNALGTCRVPSTDGGVVSEDGGGNRPDAAQEAPDAGSNNGGDDAGTTPSCGCASADPMGDGSNPALLVALCMGLLGVRRVVRASSGKQV